MDTLGLVLGEEIFKEERLRVRLYGHKKQRRLNKKGI